MNIMCDWIITWDVLSVCQRAYLLEICEYMSIPGSTPKRFIEHRWLSCYDVALSTQTMLPAYKVLYFLFVDEEDMALYKEPLEQLYAAHHVNEKAQRRIQSFHKDLSSKGKSIHCSCRLWLDNMDKWMGISMVCQHWPACSLSDICFGKSTNKSFDIFSSRNDTAGQKPKAASGQETVAWRHQNRAPSQCLHRRPGYSERICHGVPGILKYCFTTMLYHKACIVLNATPEVL